MCLECATLGSWRLSTKYTSTAASFAFSSNIQCRAECLIHWLNFLSNSILLGEVPTAHDVVAVTALCRRLHCCHNFQYPHKVVDLEMGEFIILLYLHMLLLLEFHLLLDFHCVV